MAEALNMAIEGITARQDLTTQFALAGRRSYMDRRNVLAEAEVEK